MSSARLMDDLARALAQPMPRRRALRLLSSFIVAAALPGAALARSTRRPARLRLCSKAESAAGVRECCTTFTCDKEAGYGDQECCEGEKCCGKQKCCGKGKRCDPDGMCVTCKPPLVRCGPKCCLPGRTCCTRPRTNTPEGFPDNLRVVCCKPPNVCSQGICKCPSGKEICNGRTCCKQGEHCANCVDSRLDSQTIFTGKQKCCPRGFDCCGSACIDRALQCCKGKPCPRAKPYCSLTGDCCAEEQYTTEGVCCPAGTVATPDGACCPPGQESC